MSGPALKQKDSHRAIHDAAHGEADELTGTVVEFMAGGKMEAAKAAARLLVEHWRTRTLRHAEEEEAGLYQEIVLQDPDRIRDIAGLTRDHALMRTLVDEAEEKLNQGDEGSFAEALERFRMLLWLVVAHSREEERTLLANS